MKKRQEPPAEGPASRIVRDGLTAASPLDLLAVAMAPNPDQAEDTFDIARAMLRSRTIRQLADLARDEISKLTPLSDYEALRLQCAIEIGRRAGIAGKGTVTKINGPRDVAMLFEYLEDAKEEHFCTLLLTSQKTVLAVRTVHIGTVNQSLVSPAAVFRDAIRETAASIVVVHNHPSGNPEPSDEDVLITLRLASAGNMLCIPLDDHVIIGHHKYVSLRERGHVRPEP